MACAHCRQRLGNDVALVVDLNNIPTTPRGDAVSSKVSSLLARWVSYHTS
ncbi:MAG: hypothetical protein OYH77_08490 [Pseudomonadota bacterium]|nr:hypothetical protein [Pseudomonadota bacterium]